MVTTKSKTTKSKTAKSKTTKSDAITTYGKIWRFVLAVAIPLGGGFLVSMLTRDAMGQFGMFKQPPLAPPAWLFPVVWTILYILMGIASYLIYLKLRQSKKSERSSICTALVVYGLQLVLNFIWTPIFFNVNLYWLAFAVIVVMWILELILLVKSHKISRPAFWCLFPYFLWTTFATYLNVSIAILN